jgi:hypothetical protein
VLFLLLLAWGALHGGIRQLPLSRTVGQQAQTVVQLACGMLTLFVVITAVGRPRRQSVGHRIWLAALVVAAGLSALVWGPPMPVMALVFAMAALLAGLGTLRALRT